MVDAVREAANDRALCLLPRDVVDFAGATQPKEWKKLGQHYGDAVKEQFPKRLASEIERRGARSTCCATGRKQAEIEGWIPRVR